MSPYPSGSSTLRTVFGAHAGKAFFKGADPTVPKS
jgi:hypothetical protein